MPVFFHSEETNYHFTEKLLFKKWIKEIIKKHNCEPGTVNVILTSNEYLLKINQDYLQHNYFTDVITFNYNLESKISGDIFVSVDQVRLNSTEHKVDFKNELSRVIIHGLLHLIGFDDKSNAKAEEMRQMENDALSMLKGLRDGERI